MTKEIGGSNSILNRKVDSDPADWRHSVGRIANAKQSRT